jgi:hypothetical protein
LGFFCFLLRVFCGFLRLFGEDKCRHRENCGRERHTQSASAFLRAVSAFVRALVQFNMRGLAPFPLRSRAAEPPLPRPSFGGRDGAAPPSTARRSCDQFQVTLSAGALNRVEQSRSDQNVQRRAETLNAVSACAFLRSFGSRQHHQIFYKPLG